MKSEFRQNLGRLGLFYGNKTQVPLQVRFFLAISRLDSVSYGPISIAELHAGPELAGGKRAEAQRSDKTG